MPAYNKLALEIFHQTHHTYIVSARADVARGAAQARTTIDPQDPEIAWHLEQIEKGKTDALLLTDVGAWLFEHLFVGDVRSAYAVSLDDAVRRGLSGVHLSLHFTANAEQLIELPWMLLYDPGRQRWLGNTNNLHPWTPLSYEVQKNTLATEQLPLPLKILVVAANPFSRELDSIDARPELEHIQEALRVPATQGLVRIKALLPSAQAPVSRTALQGKLQAWQPHIVHFLGHGPQSRNTAFTTPSLLLEMDRHDSTGKFSADACLVDEFLALLFAAAGSVSLVVLNACNSDGFAWKLAQQGFVAIGMRYPIYEDAARQFAQGFYETLTAGYPIDEVVNHARAQILLHIRSERSDWAAPTLFLPFGQPLCLPPVKGSIEVSSTPPGARIWCKAEGGTFEDQGKETPAALSVDIGSRYTLQVHKYGYLPQEETISVSTADAYPVSFSLVRAQARLRVVTTVRGEPLASVRIIWSDAADTTQSKDLGTTDTQGVLEAEVPVGDCRLQAMHVLNSPGQWYGTQERSPVEIRPDDSTQVYIEFSRDVSDTTLRVTSFPRGAAVWVNGEPLSAEKTPVTLSVVPGLYRVQVRKAGYLSVPRTQHVQSRPASSQALKFLLLPIKLQGSLLRVLVALGLALGIALGGEHWWTVGQRFPAGMVRFPAGAFHKGGESTPLIELMRKYASTIANLDVLIDAKPERGHIGREFWLDHYEVTNGEYGPFLTAMQGLSPADHRRLHPDEPPGKDHTPAFWQNATYNQPDQPVVGVDWYDAAAYCQWARKRLPTGDEWERAARGTDGRLYPWGDTFDKKKANTGEGPHDRPRRGGQYPEGRSPEGVDDLVGNVSEWTVEVIQVGDQRGQSIRGGSWQENGDIYGLVFLKRGASWTYRERTLGFRCARDGTGSAPSPTNMVRIPAGEFVKGAQSSKPSVTLTLARSYNLSATTLRRLLQASPAEVALREFALDAYEVTNQAYRRFLEKGARRSAGDSPEEKERYPAGKDHHPDPDVWNDANFNQPRQPVVGVDWYDAAAYCRWMGKRLPTEEEWERAARGTAGRLYPWGNTFEDNRCNSRDARQPAGKTVAVGDYKHCTSPEGIYDLVGNADEWTSTKATRENGKEGRVVRGGSWEERGEVRGLGYFSTVAAPEYRGKDMGIRCAADPRRSWWERLWGWGASGSQEQ